MKRKTISKRFGAKLRVYNEWLKSNRTLTTPEIMLKTAAKLQGHYGYYGVTDHARKIGAIYYGSPLFGAGMLFAMKFVVTLLEFRHRRIGA